MFESAIKMNSAYFEVTYKYLMKAFFNQTNKQKNEFEQQILLHNIWLINLLAMRDILNYHTNRNIIQTEKNNKAKVTKSSELLNLFKWHLNSVKLSNL